MKVGDLVTIAWIPDSILSEVREGLDLTLGFGRRVPWVETRITALVRDEGLTAVPDALTCDTVIVRETASGALVTAAGPRFWRRRGRMGHAGPGKCERRLADLLEDMGGDASELRKVAQ